MHLNIRYIRDVPIFKMFIGKFLEALPKMKLSRLLPLLFLFSSLGAMAQVSVYGEFGAAKLNVPDTSWIYGPTFGAYYDPLQAAIVSVGLDARGAFLGTGSTKLNSGMIGPRLVLTPHAVPLHPYVEGLIGVGHYQFGPGGAQTSATKFEYQFLGGLDLTVLPRIDWRLVEFSYGGVSYLSSSFNPKTISMGIVVRLP